MTLSAENPSRAHLQSRTANDSTASRVRWSLVRLGVLWIVTATLGVPAVAHGQVTDGAAVSSDEEQARVHFEQGVLLFQEESYETALAEFRTSYELVPSPRVLYNIGVVERALRRYADAVETLGDYLAATAGTNESEERREAVRAIVAELESILGDLVIDSEPEGADLFVDGELQGRTPLEGPLRLEAGEHEVELRIDGYHTHRMTLDVRSRTENRQLVELEPLPPTPVYRRWWFWTTIGVVLAGVVVAAVVPFTITPDEADFGQLQLTSE